jgi:hypothetical protein
MKEDGEESGEGSCHPPPEIADYAQFIGRKSG